jgi:hypothetical protein
MWWDTSGVEMNSPIIGLNVEVAAGIRYMFYVNVRQWWIIEIGKSAFPSAASHLI